ncbi:MAG: tetratricopeptide repeat-containing S1 family peptidase [Nitrospinales bacterium]
MSLKKLLSPQKALKLTCLLILIVSMAGISHAYEVNKNAVVLLISKGADGKDLSTGTGFIVKPDGTLLTNYHVLVDAFSVDAIFNDGTVVPVKGILKVDRKKDFSFIKLGSGVYSTLELGDSDKVEAFDFTAALGYPSQGVKKEAESWKGSLLQAFGFALGKHTQAYPDFSFIYATTPFVPGFSGGPLIDEHNKVVGLATLEGQSINLALPINYVKPFLNETGLISFDHLREEDKSSKEAIYYRGNFALYGDGDSEKAIELFNKVLKMDPDFVLAHYDMAVAYRKQGELDLCISAYEKVLKIHPNFPSALSNLGGQYFRKGETEKAVKLFKRAIDIYPNFIQALSNLGASLNKLGRAEEAIPILKKALALNPEFSVSYYNLGNSLFAGKNYVAAREAYDTAVKQGVDFLSLHWKLFEINQEEGKKRLALEEIKIILELDPENEEAQQKLKELQKP